MTADERKPALDEEATGGQTDLTTPDNDFRTPGETQNGEPDPWEVGSDPGAYTDEFEADEPPTGELDEPQTGEPDEPQTGEPDEPQTGEPDEPQTGEPDEPQIGEPDEPQTGEPDEPQTGEPENPGAEELPHDESGDGQANAAETEEDVNGKPEASAAGEESAEGQTEGQNEEQTEGQDEEPEELKMVVRVKDGRATVAVWRSGADPHMETFPETSNLEELLSKLPGMIERANSRWAANPMRPKYKPQKSPRKKKVGNSQPGNNQQTAEPNNTQQLNLQPETPQGGMARLF